MREYTSKFETKRGDMTKRHIKCNKIIELGDQEDMLTA